MRILTFKRFIVLAAVGGVAYVHKQRGGEWTVASIKDTLRYLWSRATTQRGETTTQGKTEMRDTLDRAAGVNEPGGKAGVSSTSGASDTSHGSRAYGEYGGRKDDTGRY
ncbi:MAG TPA: hypothetical protein VFT22_31210 [Kofleriaceae bacterium]|nr:hypothetical protein [Kofleriaceae bacterium]